MGGSRGITNELATEKELSVMLMVNSNTNCSDAASVATTMHSPEQNKTNGISIRIMVSLVTTLTTFSQIPTFWKTISKYYSNDEHSEPY
jgi:hypothetical protein